MNVDSLKVKDSIRCRSRSDLFIQRPARRACEALLQEIDQGSDLVTEPYFGDCDVVGDYFCDSSNGEDVGWSGETLSVYPLSPGFELEDGTMINRDVVTPNYRNYTKNTYNLIMNGGFEQI